MLKKIWGAKATHIFSAKKFLHIWVSLVVKFNESLTNDIVSFEQLGPGLNRYLYKIGFAIRKPVFGHKRAAKARISMRIRAVCSGPSLFANRIIGYYSMYEESKGSDDTLRMHRMIWICADCPCSNAHFRLMRLNYDQKFIVMSTSILVLMKTRMNASWVKENVMLALSSLNFWSGLFHFWIYVHWCK